MASNWNVLEGGTLRIPFYGVSGDFDFGLSDGYKWYTSSGTAIDGQDFTGAIKVQGPFKFYPVVFSHAIVVATTKDDIFEGNETFRITFDYFGAEHYDYNITIIDTTNKSVFLDMNADGIGQQVEITGYNFRNYLQAAESQLVNSRYEIDLIETRLAEIDEVLNSSAGKSYYEAIVAMRDALDKNQDNISNLGRQIDNFSPNDIFDLKSVAGDGKDLYDRVKDFASDPTGYNFLQGLAQAGDSLLSVLGVKSKAKQLEKGHIEIVNPPIAVAINVAFEEFLKSIDLAELRQNADEFDAEKILLEQKLNTLNAEGKIFNDNLSNLTVLLNSSDSSSSSLLETNVSKLQLGGEIEVVETEVDGRILAFSVGTDKNDVLTYKNGTRLFFEGGDGVDTLKIDLNLNGETPGILELKDGYVVDLGNGSSASVISVEHLQFLDETVYLDIAGEVLVGAHWRFDTPSIEVAASTYQFFTGIVPGAGGFEFLIWSPINEVDLNDAFYDQFNAENRFINFANNLGSFGEGKDAFTTKYGSLTFEETVKQAFEEIITSQAVTDKGNDPQASIDFFLNAFSYYSAVANQRVVPSGIEFDQAVKVVAVGSILHEAMKENLGRYSDAIDVLSNEITISGTSFHFGQDLFG